MPASEAFSQGKVCTRLQHLHARTFKVRRSLARWPRHGASSAHQDTASAQRVSLVIRSDDSGMSHSANTGSGHRPGTPLSLSICTTPTAPRFPATATPLMPRRWRSALCITNERPIALIGWRQPRFNLVVTHVGIDDQELGALGDGTGHDSLPRVGESIPVPSRVSASASRLATFSS